MAKCIYFFLVGKFKLFQIMGFWRTLPVPKYRNSIRHFRADESYVPSYFAHLAVRKSNAFEKHTNNRFPVSGHRFLRFRRQVFPSNCRPLVWYSIVFFWLFPAYLMMTHSVQSCFVPKSKVAVTKLQFGRDVAIQNHNIQNLNVWHPIFCQFSSVFNGHRWLLSATFDQRLKWDSSISAVTNNPTQKI